MSLKMWVEVVKTFQHRGPNQAKMKGKQMTRKRRRGYSDWVYSKQSQAIVPLVLAEFESWSQVVVGLILLGLD